MATSTGVFNHYDLVEEIIMLLPLRQMLHLQRLNKTAAEVVKRSPTVRRALFLVPKSELLDDYYYYRKNVQRRLSQHEQPRQVKPLIINPFLGLDPSACRTIFWSLNVSGTPHALKLYFQEHDSRSRRRHAAYAKKKEDGILRSMLLTTPAAKKVRLVDITDPCSEFEVINHSGVRYGDVRHFDELKTPHFYDADGLWFLPKAIDNITGWEMLAIMELDYEGLTKVIK